MSWANKLLERWWKKFISLVNEFSAFISLSPINFYFFCLTSQNWSSAFNRCFAVPGDPTRSAIGRCVRVAALVAAPTPRTPDSFPASRRWSCCWQSFAASAYSCQSQWSCSVDPAARTTQSMCCPVARRCLPSPLSALWGRRISFPLIIKLS